MKAKFTLPAAVLVMLTLVGSARSEDLRAVMEADNARWLTAYNTNTPAAFPAMYTEDAVVLPPGCPDTAQGLERFHNVRSSRVLDVLRPGTAWEVSWSWPRDCGHRNNLRCWSALSTC